MQDKNEVSPHDELLGVWRLTSAYVVAQETGERRNLYGDNPRGYVIFHPSGRMMVLITWDPPKAPGTNIAIAQPLGSMLSYSGIVSVDAKAFTTAVDIASVPTWVSTEQVRFYTLSPGKLTIQTAAGNHPAFPGQNVIGYLELAGDEPAPRPGLL